ncbi:MAG: SDR family NAD(P)-dependent oxidoreductase [Actinomycetota bacterium]|jgi:NAD(P)-dependent dehydrogenase (short-subunit alcohol dehydrogenase family)|nr:SDR family NAD(P)-dependent oxidoreductase [Actinomycetota bacterium]
MDDLDGKTVLLTGSSSGIGAAAAAAFGDAGAALVAHYGRDADGAARATSRIPRERRLLVAADFAEPGSGRALWAKAVSWRGRIDVLVLNAAVQPLTPIDAPDAEWDATWSRVLQVNVLEPASLMREAVRHFRASGGGTVVTVSSWAAEQGSALSELTAYAASKAAVRAMTQTVARVHGKDGVLAFVVAPSIVRTPMSEISLSTRGGEDLLAKTLPLGCIVPAEDVAKVVVLAAAAGGCCRHLSGATLDVNGAAYVR